MDKLLPGRNTYEILGDYWPTDAAKQMFLVLFGHRNEVKNGIRKNLKSADRQNTELGMRLMRKQYKSSEKKAKTRR